MSRVRWVRKSCSIVSTTGRPIPCAPPGTRWSAVSADTWLDLDLHERAELVVSELASNAVQASPGAPYRLCVAIEPTESVVIAVDQRDHAGRPAPARGVGPDERARQPTRSGAADRRPVVRRRRRASDPAAGQIVVTATLR